MLLAETTYQIGLEEADSSCLVHGTLPLLRRFLDLLDLIKVLPYTLKLLEQGVILSVNPVQTQRR